MQGRKSSAIRVTKMLELPKPKPKRNVRSGAAHSRLLLRFLPQRLATRLHLSLAKHLVNRSRRRMSQTAENLICRAEGGQKKAARTPCARRGKSTYPRLSFSSRRRRRRSRTASKQLESQLGNTCPAHSRTP